MSPSRMDVIVGQDPEEATGFVLGSPAVGHFSSPPRVGEVVVGGSTVGGLKSLGRRIDLVGPRGVTGRVAEIESGTRDGPVGYGQNLLRLVPV